MMISAQLFRYVTDNNSMNIRTQSNVSCNLIPSRGVSGFDFLNPEEREPAQLSYEFFSNLIASRRVMPSRVWFDLDGTLIRLREKKDPVIEKNDPTKEAEYSFVFQGAIVGAMFAFYEGGVDIGIFSFWESVEILNLISENSFLTQMVSLNAGGTPLIRGVEHINEVAESLASPRHNLHAVLNEENGAIYFDTLPMLTENRYRAMKIIGAYEVLIDDDDVDEAYRTIAHYFARGNTQRGTELALVDVIDESTKGYLQLDDPDGTPIPKYLSQAEMNRAMEIFNRLERSHG